MGDLYTYVARSEPETESTELRPRDERVARAAIMREAALKCAVFVGVPKVRFNEAFRSYLRHHYISPYEYPPLGFYASITLVDLHSHDQLWKEPCNTLLECIMSA